MVPRVPVASTASPCATRSHAAVRAHSQFWEVAGKVLDQVVEEEVTVVLGVCVVGEVCLGHHLSRTDDLKGESLWDIVL